MNKNDQDRNSNQNNNPDNQVTGRQESDVYSTMKTIEKELSKLSNKKVKDVLTMLGSTRNLRLTSVFAPISEITAQTISVNRQGGRVKKMTPPAKAAWRCSPEWKSAEAEHLTLVNKLKACTEESDKASIIRELRNLEDSMKQLREDLRSFRN